MIPVTRTSAVSDEVLCLWRAKIEVDPCAHAVARLSHSSGVPWSERRGATIAVQKVAADPRIAVAGAQRADALTCSAKRLAKRRVTMHCVELRADWDSRLFSHQAESKLTLESYLVYSSVGWG